MQTSLAPAQVTPPNPPFDTPKLSWFSTAFLFVFGILLPAITLLVESLTHMCARDFFDPLPTVGHVFAVAAVPLANGISLWVLRRGDGRHLEAVIFGQAFAVAIAGAYALMFAPITPLAMYAFFVALIGILPLAPLLSLFAGLRALLALRRLRGALARPTRRVVLGGLAAGLGLLLALNAPAALTRVFMYRATSADPEVSGSAVGWLQRIGQRDLIMRAAFTHQNADVVNVALDLLAPLSCDQAREVYLRVTGRNAEEDLALYASRRRSGRL